MKNPNTITRTQVAAIYEAVHGDLFVHHNTLKKAFREVVGADCTEFGFDVEALRAFLSAPGEAVATDDAPVAEEAPAHVETPAADEASKTEAEPLPEWDEARKKEYIREMAQEDPNWLKVVDIAKINAKGKPTRVVIECQHPGCIETREIATQDLFQVRYCVEHQKEAARAAARRRRAERKAAAAK